MSSHNTTQHRASAAVIKNMQHLHKVSSTSAPALQEEYILPLHMVTCLNFFFFFFKKKQLSLTPRPERSFPSVFPEHHERARAPCLQRDTRKARLGEAVPRAALLSWQVTVLTRPTQTRCPAPANATDTGYFPQETIFSCSSICCEGALQHLTAQTQPEPLRSSLKGLR